MGSGSYIFAFVVMLGVLVFVHELGHFLVAKACGVRVLKFSLGFGSPVGFGRFRMAWTRGGTEYVVAWIPLGGFVKMLGESLDATEDDEAAAHPDETLNGKPLWQKLSIVFAGPAMNLAFPVLVFSLMLSVGLQNQDTTIGTVEEGSPAAEAGFLPGDRITQIANEPVTWWRDVASVIREHPGASVEVAFERDGAAGVGRLPVGERSLFNEFGIVEKFGWSGLAHSRLRAMLAIPDPDAAALAAGLRSGDVVTAVNGVDVEDWHGFATAYAAERGPVSVLVARGVEEDAEEVTLELPARGDVGALGVSPAAVLIEETVEGSPADRAGLQAEDIVLAVDGQHMGSFAAFSNTVKTSGGRTLSLAVSRAGETLQLDVTPELTPLDNGLATEDQYFVGVSVQPTTLVGSMALDRERNPFVSVPRAVGMTVDLTVMMVRGVGKLITGEVSRKNIAGPIGIAQIAGNALAIGWETYLQVMVFISINLGILNLLPIPILDGGQALIYSVEGIRRAPLSLRMREIIQHFGLTVLLLLMGLAFWNDISRHWSTFVDWFRDGTG